jgi:hypothetical protein
MVVLEGIGHAGSTRLAREVIQRAVGNSDPAVRAVALQAAYIVSPFAFRDDLLAGLRDPDAWVRRLAAQSLWSFRGSRYRVAVAEALLEIALNTEEDLEVRMRAAQSLTFYRLRSIRSTLMELCIREPYFCELMPSATSVVNHR